MIKLSVLTALTAEQYVVVSTLWVMTGISSPQRGDSYEAICHTLANGARLVIAWWDEIPVGTVWLTHDFRRLYIHHMAVHPQYQNKGIGKHLMEEALTVAKELKLQAKLEVHCQNKAAYRLYRKYGFITLEGYHTMIRRDT